MTESERDIVEVLQSWIRGSVPQDPVTILQRASDAIVGLRGYAQVDQIGPLLNRLRSARNEALEEAAHECDEEAKGSSEGFRDGCETCAAAIRTLVLDPDKQ